MKWHHMITCVVVKWYLFMVLDTTRLLRFDYLTKFIAKYLFYAPNSSLMVTFAQVTTNNTFRQYVLPRVKYKICMTKDDEVYIERVTHIPIKNILFLNARNQILLDMK